MLRPHIKKAWIDALRSGKYKQGNGMLKNGNKYCCLGVLCDVIDPSRWSGNIYDLTPVIQLKYALAHDVSDAIGINAIEHSHLITMNDKLAFNFNRIADWVEENL